MHRFRVTSCEIVLPAPPGLAALRNDKPQSQPPPPTEPFPLIQPCFRQAVKGLSDPQQKLYDPAGFAASATC